MAPSGGSDRFPDALFRQLLEGNVLGVGFLDVKAQIRWVNPAMAELMRTTVDDMVGRGAFEYLHPDDLERAMLAFGAVSTGYSGTQGRFRVRRADGSVVPVDLFHTTFPDAVVGADGTAELLHLMMFRVDDYQHAFSEALEGIGEGRTFTEVASAALGGVQYGERQLVTGLTGTDDDGDPVAIGPLPASMVGFSIPPGSPAQIAADGQAPAAPPWSTAARTGQPVQFHANELTPDVRADALRQGLVAGVVVPIADPWAGRSVLVTGWSDDPDHLDVFQLALSGQVRRLLVLALERRHRERQLEEVSRRDALTGLGNRRLLFEELARQRRHPEHRVALIYLDLDDFKPVNDRLGHATGDALLRSVSARLAAAAPDDAVVVRFGGDEFVVVLARPSITADEALAGADKLRAAVSETVEDGAVAISVGATAGVALGPTSVDVDDLLRAADDALYAAKRSGKGSSRLVTLD